MKTTLAAVGLGLLILGAAGSTADAQYYRYDQGYYGYDGAPRPRVRVYPRSEPYFDDYSNFYPAARGFADRNPVPRGNRRGCTVDLGYGRYESCDR